MNQIKPHVKNIQIPHAISRNFNIEIPDLGYGRVYKN